jgi:hypothetical protein
MGHSRRYSSRSNWLTVKGQYVYTSEVKSEDCLLNVTGWNKMQGFLVGNCSRLPCVHYSEMPSRIEKNMAGRRGKDKNASRRAAATSLNYSRNDEEEDEEEMSESSVVVGKENVIAEENDNLKKR